MSVDLHRWQRDESRPSGREAVRDAAARVLGPSLVLFATIVSTGWLIMGPFGGLEDEAAVNRELQEGRSRTALWDTTTDIWSRLGNTEIIIGTCAVISLIILWRTRQWWYAAIPAIAISIQATIFVIAAWIVGRERPDVEKLDPAPPTSSYPSGHVGAATALFLTFAFMAQRIERIWLRRLVTVVCILVPILVSYARLYRGMHHLTDVLLGVLNGVVCALLAWHWLRRRRD
ncbi:MAG TPA: phosphatase PAP2 family protein [Intrasporangium sp.]|uniref:phosphatase PAP2 family protein n=1 Tax=Intrasporangium sp. TaxID=1925024 RepID=UPI002B45A790|nr:phosphatase PAP2 family protein [Intrasporangium sp.]HKX68258.1 phosphatase PAP2 family protein [Intrasporangium sp.]